MAGGGASLGGLRDGPRRASSRRWGGQGRDGPRARRGLLGLLHLGSEVILGRVAPAARVSKSAAAAAGRAAAQRQPRPPAAWGGRVALGAVEPVVRVAARVLEHSRRLGVGLALTLVGVAAASPRLLGRL